MAQFAWADGDDSVKVTTCAAGVDPQDEYEKLIRIGIIPRGARMLLEPRLPDDRALRHKWRIVGQAIVVDPTVPDPPNPRQPLFDAIDSATTLADLKAVLKANL